MANLQIPNLEGADAKLGEHVFEFVQFLLDDDLNLTPAGNLTGDARKKLRDRLNELIAAEEAGSQAMSEGSPVTPDAPAAEAP
ncbi:MAG TPA: hypothetical protein VFE62_25435 [Gemmataceae bacterium]|nr:hypothetical protein [Gemmataceae bacterium]